MRGRMTRWDDIGVAFCVTCFGMDISYVCAWLAFCPPTITTLLLPTTILALLPLRMRRGVAYVALLPPKEEKPFSFAL